MKTATVKIYQIYGTKSAICADVSYRSKLLTYVENLDLEALHAIVKTWARNRKFTHVRMVYEIAAINRACKIKI